jgi:hypothetical protein
VTSLLHPTIQAAVTALTRRLHGNSVARGSLVPG